MTVELLSARSCGSCTLCCKVMSIDELAKPQGVWCPHCSPGRGCDIYGTHPPTCQGFRCGWLTQSDFPDDARPDRSKVVLEIDSSGSRIIARCDPGFPFAWQREPIYGQLKGWARRGWNSRNLVVAITNRRLWLITPGADIDAGEIGPNSPFAIDERPDGSISVKVLSAIVRPTGY